MCQNLMILARLGDLRTRFIWVSFLRWSSAAPAVSLDPAIVGIDDRRNSAETRDSVPYVAPSAGRAQLNRIACRYGDLTPA
jgi:hypothetical protein